RGAEPSPRAEPVVRARAASERDPPLGLAPPRGAARLLRDRARGACRAPGVVLARTRIPEDEEDAIREHAGELPAGARRELGVDGMLGVQRLVDLFGIERTPRDRRDREAARDDRQLAALAAAQIVPTPRPHPP